MIKFKGSEGEIKCYLILLLTLTARLHYACLFYIILYIGYKKTVAELDRCPCMVNQGMLLTLDMYMIAYVVIPMSWTNIILFKNGGPSVTAYFSSPSPSAFGLGTQQHPHQRALREKASNHPDPVRHPLLMKNHFYPSAHLGHSSYHVIFNRTSLSSCPGENERKPQSCSLPACLLGPGFFFVPLKARTQGLGEK